MPTQRGTITRALFLLCLLGLLSHTTSAYGPLNHSCCVKYTRKPLPFHLIKGFVEQRSWEVCRIDAIIFITQKDRKVCASADDDWVKDLLTHLSDKLKTMVSNGTTEEFHIATPKFS